MWAFLKRFTIVSMGFTAAVAVILLLLTLTHMYSEPKTYLMDPHDPEGELIELSGSLTLFVLSHPVSFEDVDTTKYGLINALNDDNEFDFWDKGYAHKLLAEIYASENDVEKALDEYQVAIDFFIDAEAEFWAAKTLQSMARTTFEENNIATIIGYYLRAEKLYLLANEPLHAEYVRKIAERLKNKQ